MKRVTIPTRFSVTGAMLWTRVERTDLLFYETGGLIEFGERGMFPGLWEEAEGMTIETTLRPFGVGSTAPYRIMVRRVDPTTFTIETEEEGAGGKLRWKHKRHIRAEYLGGCTLIDEIEIKAGWLTWFYAAFAKVYYRIRHRRLRRLLRAGM